MSQGQHVHCRHSRLKLTNIHFKAVLHDSCNLKLAAHLWRPHPTSPPEILRSLLVPPWNQGDDLSLNLQHGAAHRCLKSGRISRWSLQLLSAALPVCLCSLSTHRSDESEAGDPQWRFDFSQMTNPATNETKASEGLEMELSGDCRWRRNSWAGTCAGMDNIEGNIVVAVGGCTLVTDLGREEVRL